MLRWRRPPDAIVLEAAVFRTLEGDPDPEGFLALLEWLKELRARRQRVCRCVYLVYPDTHPNGKPMSVSSLLRAKTGARVVYADQTGFRRQLTRPALLLAGAV